MSHQNYAKRIMFSIGFMIGISVCLSVPALAFITVDRYISDCNSILDLNALSLCGFTACGCPTVAIFYQR